MAVNATLIGTVGTTGGTGASVTTGGGTSVSGSDFIIEVVWSPTAAGNADLSTVQDIYNNTWVQKGATSTTPNGDLAIAQFVALNGTGGTGHTATANFVNAFSFATIYLVQVTGTNHTVDVAFTQAPGPLGSTNYPITSGVLAQATEGVVVFGSVDTASIAGFSATNFTILDSNTGGGAVWPICIGFALPGTTASTTYTFSYPDFGNHASAQAIMTFEAAGGAPADQPPSHEWDFDEVVIDDWESWDSALVGQNSVVPGPDDAWDWYADDLTDDFVESNSQPVVPNSIIPVYEDPWDWFGDDLTDDYHLEHDSRVPPIALGIPAIDDAWDWYADDYTEEFEVYATTPVGANAVVQPAPPVEDAWDWYADDLTDDFYYESDSKPVVANSIVLPIDDAWDWYADDLTEEFEVYATAPVVADVVLTPASPPQDEWDWWSDDYEDELVILDDSISENYIPPEDPWDWDDIQDEDWWFTESSPVVPDALVVVAQTFDDWDFSVDDVIDDFDADSQPVGPNSVNPTIEDAWDWSSEDQGEDDWWFTFDPPQTIAIDSTFYGDDAWDWSEDIGDDLWEEGSSPVAANAGDRHFGNEDWPWEEDGLEDSDWWFEAAPVVADVIASTTPPDDAWDWFTEDSTDDYDTDSAPVTLDAVALSIDDAWDWFTDDLTDEFESDASPVVADVVPQVPIIEDAWDWSAEDVGDDEWWWVDVVQDSPVAYELDWNWDEDSTDDEWWWFDSAPVALPPLVTTAPELDWNWDEDAVDDWWGDENFTLVDLVTFPSPVDSWDWDEDATDDLWEDTSGPVGINATIGRNLSNEDWPWEEDAVEDDDWWNEFQPVPANAGGRNVGNEDWPWWEEDHADMLDDMLGGEASSILFVNPAATQLSVRTARTILSVSVASTSLTVKCARTVFQLLNPGA
jgi:hypothetical protein